jgi:hypothetical protein
MAVPSAVTVDEIVTEALKRAGRTTPSSTAISSAKANQFREVKSDMEELYGLEFPDLYGEQAGATVIGETTLAGPTTVIAGIESVTLYEPGTDTGWTGTIQSATSTSMTLGATLDEEPEKLQGRYTYIDTGTGSGQLPQLSNWNNTTKEAQITGTFETTLDGTSTYIIASDREHALQEDLIRTTELNTDLIRGMPTKWSTVWSEPGPSTNQNAAVRSIRWNYVPDKVYPIRYVVRYAIDHLDETLGLLVGLLRKHRSTWIQGVAAYSMQLYDEDRFLMTYQIYQQKLEQLGSKNMRIYQMKYTDG